MKIRMITSFALGLVAAFAVGCASTDSNSAVVSVEDVSGRNTVSTSSPDRPPHIQSNANISNTPVPRNFDGQPIDRLSPQEKLRRSRK